LETNTISHTVDYEVINFPQSSIDGIKQKIPNIGDIGDFLFTKAFNENR
jgi:hypothetical protein